MFFVMKGIMMLSGKEMAILGLAFGWLIAAAGCLFMDFHPELKLVAFKALLLAWSFCVVLFTICMGPSCLDDVTNRRPRKS